MFIGLLYNLQGAGGFGLYIQLTTTILTVYSIQYNEKSYIVEYSIDILIISYSYKSTQRNE